MRKLWTVTKSFLTLLKWKFRIWLFKMLFGIDLRGLIRVSQHFALMSNQIEETRKELRALQDFTLEVVDLTGGPGWVHTIQQAIMQLDRRLDELHHVAVQHQHNFDAIAAEKERLASYADKVPKKHLN